MKDISSGKILYVVVGYSRVGIHRKTSTFSVAGPRTTTGVIIIRTPPLKSRIINARGNSGQKKVE